MSQPPLLPCPPIDALVLPGRTVDLERLDVDRHGGGLWEAIGRRDDLWTWIPSGPFPTQESFSAWLADRGAMANQTLYAVIDKTTAEPAPAGLYMALRTVPEAGVTEVGLNLGPALARRVGGTEAFHLLASHIMSLGYRRLEWRCSPENVASGKAALRFGFTLEGTLRQTYWLKGVNWDTDVYSILDSEWPAIAARLSAWLAADNFDAAGEQKRPLSAF